MFQNLLISPIVPFGKAEELNNWENQPFTTVWPKTENHRARKEPEITKTIKKKPKRFRTAFTTEQLRALENTFAITKYVDGENRKQLSESLNISDKAIKIWFQNRRMKEKRDSDSWDTSTASTTSPPLNNQTPNSDFKFEYLEHSGGPNMPAVVDTSFFTSGSTYEHSNYFPNQYQTQPTDFYEPQYQGSMLPHHVPYLGYDTNLYPTEYYPNSNGNGIYYHQGGTLTHNAYASNYNLAAKSHNNF